LAERWVAERRDRLLDHWGALRTQLLPAQWPARCERMLRIGDGEIGDWLPRPGSSSSELLLLLSPLPLFQRRWLAALLDAPTAGPATLVEALERLQLDWRSRLNPLRTHREYALQLATLVEALGLPAAAEAAYLENEDKLFAYLDERLFESLPMRLRTLLINELRPGSGAYLGWWYERILARAGQPGFSLERIGQDDWPDIPPAWVALAWISGLRRLGAPARQTA
jgi:hypothetical protein